MTVPEVPQSWPGPARQPGHKSTEGRAFDPRRLVAFQFSFGPAVFPAQANGRHAIDVEAVELTGLDQ